MLNSKITDNFINLIHEAEAADDDRLISLRKKFIMALERIGPKQFVTVMADILKNNFKIQGCNDARIPLKKIFAISLEELEQDLSIQSYDLPGGHPLVFLSEDHKDNIKKLKMLRFSLGGLNLNKNSSPDTINNKIKQTKEYYEELDSHIRKEEEILFPSLEESGMREHPENLREEHKLFRDVLSKIIEGLKNLISGKSNSTIEEIRNLKEKFILDISNHIFRETYVFYPAALEFINDVKQWEKIKDGFSKIAIVPCSS